MSYIFNELMGRSEVKSELLEMSIKIVALAAYQRPCGYPGGHGLLLSEAEVYCLLPRHDKHTSGQAPKFPDTS